MTTWNEYKQLVQYNNFTTIVEAWDAEGVERTAKTGYGINMKGGKFSGKKPPKTPFDYMKISKSTGKKYKVQFGLGKKKEMFTGTAEEVADKINDLFGFTESIEMDEGTPAYRKAMAAYKNSDAKKVFDILKKKGFRVYAQSDILVRNMLKKNKGNVQKAAAEIEKKYPGHFKESDELDEARKDVFVIVDKKGKVVAAKLTKDNAHKEISRHRDGTIVLDPDAKAGDVLKNFAKESIELDESKYDPDPRIKKMSDEGKRLLAWMANSFGMSGGPVLDAKNVQFITQYAVDRIVKQLKKIEKKLPTDKKKEMKLVMKELGESVKLDENYTVIFQMTGDKQKIVNDVMSKFKKWYDGSGGAVGSGSWDMSFTVPDMKGFKTVSDYVTKKYRNDVEDHDVFKESVELDEKVMGASYPKGHPMRKFETPASPELKKWIESGKVKIIVDGISVLGPTTRFVVVKNPNWFGGDKHDPVLMFTISDPKRGRIKMFAFHGSHVSHQKAMQFAKNNKLVAKEDAKGNPLYAKESTNLKTIVFKFPSERQAKQFEYDISNAGLAAGNRIGMTVEVDLFGGSNRRETHKALAKYMKKSRGKYVKESTNEEISTTTTSVGTVSDPLDIGHKKKKKRKCEMEKFIGSRVFEVTNDEYCRCIRGRNKYERWNKFFELDSETGSRIKNYSHKNPNAPIIIKDSQTGEMMFLRRRLNDQRLRHHKRMK